MRLKQWFSEGHGRQRRMAESLGVSESFMGAIAKHGNGDKTGRPVPVRLAHQIEAFTKGAVMRWDSCPDDWWLVWPELKRRKNAPDIPAREQASQSG